LRRFATSKGHTQTMKNGIQSGTKKDQTNRPVQTGMVLVWVKCKESNCLAYTDATGNWINFYTGERIADFVKVIG
jgi:hypothetical protein